MTAEEAKEAVKTLHGYLEGHGATYGDAKWILGKLLREYEEKMSYIADSTSIHDVARAKKERGKEWLF